MLGVRIEIWYDMPKQGRRMHAWGVKLMIQKPVLDGYRAWRSKV